jgi:hypothetical protein
MTNKLPIYREGRSDLFMPPRDLLLRPTDRAPGFYDFRDGEDEGTFAVVKHEDGKSYEMIWCDQGEGKTLTQPGDLLFEDTYMNNIDVDYGENDVVSVEKMSFDGGLAIDPEMLSTRRSE